MEAMRQRIAQHRKLKGLTQLELAEKLGVSVGAVSQWEQGKTEPTISNLKALCQILETPLEWLAFGTGPSGIEEYLVDITELYKNDSRLIYLADDQREFYADFACLPEEWRQKIIEITRLAAKEYGQEVLMSNEGKK